MAAITNAVTTGTANWSTAGTWTGGVVPGNGDTVILSGSVTITVNANTTIGASNGAFVSGTNPAAIQMNATAKLIVATGVTLTVRGDFIFNSTSSVAGFGLTMNAGSTFTWDSSATTPTTTRYKMTPISSNCYLCSIRGLGTSGSHVTMNSNAGGGSGGLIYNGTGSNFGSMNLAYTDFANWGSGVTATTAALTTYWNSSQSVTWDHVQFTNCGYYHQAVQNTGGWPFTMANVLWHTNSTVTGINMDDFQNLTATNVVFDSQQTTGNYTNASFDTCMWRNGFSPAGNASLWSHFNNNFLRLGSNVNAASEGPATNTIVLADTATANPHYLIENSDAMPFTWSGIILDQTGTDQSGDGYSLVDNPSTVQTCTIRNSLNLPNAALASNGTGCSLGGLFGPNGRVDIQHITYNISTQGVSFSENTANTPGTILAFKNNIAWANSLGSGFVMYDTGHLGSSTGLTTDVVSPTSADFNCKLNANATFPSATWFTNQGNGYAGAFSATPGAHDITQNPRFVDTTRNTATFDADYLGTVAGSTWASQPSTHTFTVGDIVSNNNAAFYGGHVINFRCTATHVKSLANSEPGFGSSYRLNWELNTLAQLRNGIFSSLTFSDDRLLLAGSTLQTCQNVDIITLLRSWISAGWAPQNCSLRERGSDGSDIGAVPCVGSFQQQQSMMGCG